MGDENFLEYLIGVVVSVLSTLFVGHVRFSRGHRIKQAEEIAVLKNEVVDLQNNLVIEMRAREMIKSELHEQLGPLAMQLNKMEAKLDTELDEVKAELSEVSVKTQVLDRLSKGYALRDS